MVEAQNIGFYRRLRADKIYFSVDAPTKDSNGTLFAKGDAVAFIKGLKVKGLSQTPKRGTLGKNISLTNLPAETEGRSGGSTIVLEMEFLKKS